VLELQKIVKRTEQIESKIKGAMDQLALELDRPVSSRNMEACEDFWIEAVSSKAKLHRVFRDLDALDVETRKPKGVKARVAREAESFLKAARARYRAWKKVEDMVAGQVNPERRDLDSQRPAIIAPVTVFDSINDLFVESMHRFANPNPQREDAFKYECFADIPLPMRYFGSLMATAYKICLAQKRGRPLKFLDVGSGGGTKVLAAATCFEICHGLEYDDDYAAAGAQMLSCVMPKRCKNIHGDGLKFEHYADYDVIYLYRPMRDPDLLREMENRIIETSRPGTIIVAPYDIRRGAEEFGAREITANIWITGSTREEIDALYEEASYIGDGVLPVANFDEQKLTYFRNLVIASVGNGWGI
jgi:hypothetical protein